VLTIMGTVAGMGLLKYSGSLSRYRADAACRRIIADLKRAQVAARTTSTERAVRFDTVAGSYTLLTRAERLAASAGAAVALGGEPYHASFTVSGLTGNTVIFDAYGAASVGGTVVVTTGTASITVTIDAETGRAYVN
jgi:hypothetical protein